MDACGLTLIRSLRESACALIIGDDLSRFTWMSHLKEKNENFKEFSKWYKHEQMSKNFLVLQEVTTEMTLTKSN